MANIDILNKQFCTGCGACSNVCPVNAITMQADEDGFLMPVVGAACTACGLCANICPQLNKSKPKTEEVHSYAVWAKDKYREKGSSGGVFPMMAEQVIKDGGVVFGAAFTPNYRAVEHVAATNSQQLQKLLKSKYVQSATKDTFRQVKELLEKGTFVLYSGCPCQIDGLKAYLRKDYDNLLTVDILCHGAPSPFAYNKFLDGVSDNGAKNIVGVDFRDKKYGWGTLIRVDLDDGTSKYEPYNGGYFRAFLSGLAMREGCYNCKYANTSRVGDITIGDFWGVDKYEPKWNDKKGTSLVIVNNRKGEEFFQKTASGIAQSEEVAYATVIEISKHANGALVRPTKKPEMRGCFFKHLKKDSFTKSLQYAEKSLLDVGITGWWIETARSNYGSTMTDYALYKFLTMQDMSVAMISPPNFDRAGAGVFNKKYNYRMTAKYTPEQMKENNKYIDAFVVASDVLWYYDAMIRSGYTFLLDFVADDKKKISYSTSFGNIRGFFPQSELPKVKYLLKRFDNVSVREFEGVDVCRDRLGVEATQVLDPVFLCDRSVWEELANNAERKTEGKFMFAYMLDPSEEKAEQLVKLAKKLGLGLVSMVDRQVDTENKEKIMSKCGVMKKATPEEFIYNLMNADFVVADSFHGFCFSLIFDKPFVTLVNRVRGAARFDTLSQIAGVKDRMVENLSEALSGDAGKLMYINHEKIQSNLNVAKARAKSWLLSALEAPKQPCKMDEKDVLAYKLSEAEKKLAAYEAAKPE